jgi:hypothetical protein
MRCGWLGLLLCLWVNLSLAAAVRAPQRFADERAYAAWYQRALLASTWSNLWVDNSWTGAVVGSEAAPFTNIQAAVDYADATFGAWSSVSIIIRNTGTNYEGQVRVPNAQALRLVGTNGMPVIVYSGSAPLNTIQSGTNYFYGAGMPPAQVGLENLRVENRSSATGELYCAAIHTWHSVEPAVTNPPARPRYGVHDCIFDGAGSKGGVLLYDLKQHPSIEGYNSNLVWRCRFENCTVGVMLLAGKETHIFENWFVSNGVAVVAVADTNSVYQRAYRDMFVYHNVMAWCADAGCRGGVYPNLVYYNNTFYECGGTDVYFNAGVLGLEGPAALHNNIFYNGIAAWVANAAATNLLVVSNNLYYALVVATGWETFGGGALTNPPGFASQTPGDPDFLCLSENSPAAHKTGLYGGATYIGALPPVPEPGVLLVGLLALGAVVRARN